MLGIFDIDHSRSRTCRLLLLVFASAVVTSVPLVSILNNEADFFGMVELLDLEPPPAVNLIFLFVSFLILWKICDKFLTKRLTDQVTHSCAVHSLVSDAFPPKCPDHIQHIPACGRGGRREHLAT